MARVKNRYMKSTRRVKRSRNMSRRVNRSRRVNKSRRVNHSRKKSRRLSKKGGAGASDVVASDSVSDAGSLHSAISNGDINKVIMVLGTGADINKANSSGLTPLQNAILLKNDDIAEFLILNGAEVNTVSSHSSPFIPLHSALLNKNINIAKLLISNGADTDKVYVSGKTPIELAFDAHLFDTVKLAVEHSKIWNSIEDFMESISVKDPEDPYRLLGVNRDASGVDIKRAYERLTGVIRQKRLKYEMEQRNMGSANEDLMLQAYAKEENDLNDAQQAYNVLINPRKRQEYDERWPTYRSDIIKADPTKHPSLAKRIN